MRNVFVTWDKLRNNLGAVGGTVKEGNVYINMARRWDGKNAEPFLQDMITYHNSINWRWTFIEQEVGQHIITELRRRGLSLKVITTQKLMKDPTLMEKVQVMDRIEMTEYLRTLKENGRVKFVKNPSPSLKQLEDQLPMFSKHTTEAGGVDYYAPGEESDDLVRGLIGVCFSFRKQISFSYNTSHVLGGVNYPKGRDDLREYDSFDNFGKFETFI